MQGEKTLRHKRLLVGGVLLAALACLPALAEGIGGSDLSTLSIEDLGNVEITSVSKTAQPLSDAAAAVFVITHDDIARSGATSIPEMLRLAPNLQVAQMSANAYAITARGFNGNAANKLLVLIDGRSVYTPLYGGVLWDIQDVLPENIERIEVISGPGATLWGANAVNGVINIITRKAADTQGGIATFGIGNREKRGSLQYGGALTDDLAYRAYIEGFGLLHGKTSTGANAFDGFTKTQGGFRLDWTPDDDSVTFQGDWYGGDEDLSANASQQLSGGNVLASWRHEFSDGSQLQALGYFDHTRRATEEQGSYSLNTYDMELQHSFAWGASQAIVWGGGFRVYQDRFDLPEPVTYLPPTRSQNLFDVFAQDTISFLPSLDLVVGLKLEADPFAALTPLPNIRLSWKPTDDILLWAAASRAVRAPTRFDVDLHDTIIPSILILTGDKDFQLEKLNAYEVGTRIQLDPAASLSASAYYNVYDDLRSVEFTQATVLPLLWSWGNLMTADTYGIELWGNYAATDWWRLSAGVMVQHQDRRFRPQSSALGGVSTAGDDPNHQAMLRSVMNIGSDVSWSADLRWIGMLHDPQVPAYAEINSSIDWKISRMIEVSLSGFNLLHSRHLEYELAGATTGTEIDRSYFIETKLRF
ncbi:MAG TPA: TonB-dependent receptor [Rhizomicrobium sp.]|nr:TonB-dependent receptor [Rhizomicrobium sp.]